MKLAWDSQLGISILPNQNRYFTVLYYYGINQIPNHASNSKPTSYTPKAKRNGTFTITDVRPKTCKRELPWNSYRKLMGPGLRELINQLQNWYKTVNQDTMLFLDVFQIINFFLTTLAIKSVRYMYQRNWFLLIAIVQLH